MSNPNPFRIFSNNYLVVLTSQAVDFSFLRCSQLEPEQLKLFFGLTWTKDEQNFVKYIYNKLFESANFTCSRYFVTRCS